MLTFTTASISPFPLHACTHASNGAPSSPISLYIYQDFPLYIPSSTSYSPTYLKHITGNLLPSPTQAFIGPYRRVLLFIPISVLLDHTGSPLHDHHTDAIQSSQLNHTGSPLSNRRSLPKHLHRDHYFVETVPVLPSSPLFRSTTSANSFPQPPALPSLPPPPALSTSDLKETFHIGPLEGEESRLNLWPSKGITFLENVNGEILQKSIEIRSEELHNDVSQVLLGYKQMLKNGAWEQCMSALEPPVKERLSKFVPVHLQPLVSNSFAYIWTVYMTYMASLEKAGVKEQDL
ncbi:hypothetical protein LXL04_029561 [Taraxacum kok-saghyz]